MEFDKDIIHLRCLAIRHTVLKYCGMTMNISIFDAVQCENGSHRGSDQPVLQTKNKNRAHGMHRQPKLTTPIILITI